MVAHLAKGHLHLPTLDEPAQHLNRVTGLISAEQGLRVEAAEGITHKNPVDRHNGHSAVIPDGCGGADLDLAFAAAIPARHADALPGRGRVDQHVGQVRQAPALGAGPPVRAGQAGRRGVVESGIKTQARDAGYPSAGGRLGVSHLSP